MTRLRYELGITYHVGDEYSPLNADVTHIALIADALEEEGETVARELIDSVQALAQDGPTKDELADEVESVRTWLENPVERPGVAYGSAFDHLLGAEKLTPADLLAGVQALTPQEVAEAGSAALETALLLLPGELKPSRPGFAPFLAWDEPEAAGTRFRPKRGLLKRRGSQVAIVGSEGVSLIDETGCATIRRSDLAAAILEQDGTVALVQLDGRWITIAPSTWNDPVGFEQLLDEFVPADRWVRMPSTEESTASG